MSDMNDSLFGLAMDDAIAKVKTKYNKPSVETSKDSTTLDIKKSSEYQKASQILSSFSKARSRSHRTV